MSLTTEQFDRIRKLVREQAGIVIEPGKEYLVESRVASLVRSGVIESVEDLVDRLRRGSTEAQDMVVDALTTNETSFFRDGAPFEALQELVLPELIERRREKRSLDIWCAASSSGQEPVSLAILLCEHFPELAQWDVRIRATDISEEMLGRCRSGLYSQLEVSRGLPARLLVKHFEKTGLKWKVCPSLHDSIDYRWMNLTEEFPALPTFDIVLIRNVLIYFDEETKLGILHRIHRTLSHDGFLMLGTAESAPSDSYKRVPFKTTSCYRLAS